MQTSQRLKKRFYANAPERAKLGDTQAIAAQRFDGTGNAVGPVVNVSGLPIGYPDISEGINMDVTLMDDGRILVVFVGDDTPGSDSVIQVILDLRNGQGEGIVLGDIADSDVLYGTSQDEAFDGRGGADIVFAGDGHDRLFGGTGDDFLFGEGGNDTITGNTDVALITASDLIFKGATAPDPVARFAGSGAVPFDPHRKFDEERDCCHILNTLL